MIINKEILLSKYYNEMIEHLKKLITFESVKKTPKNEKSSKIEPGREKALNYVLDLCKSWGWKTKKGKDGLYGYADANEGKELFGIICHLDVVPAGDLNEWEHEPFKLTETDTHYYGRGVFDDKGPTMLNLYALKYLLDNGFSPDYKIRFIFGTAEETNWECINSYVENEELVAVGYTPDGAFPCVYAEKWVLNFDLSGDYKCDFTMTGGECYNAVVDVVEYDGDKKKELIEYFKNVKEINVSEKNNKLIIKGKSAHGSLPHLAVCASTYLAKALVDLGEKHPALLFLSENIYKRHNGNTIFKDLKDESGDLTICNGIVNINKDNFLLTLDMRVPVLSDPVKDVSEVLIEATKKYNIKTVQQLLDPRVYHPKDSKLVKDIMSAYIDVTGDKKAKPVALGGGTFAKSMPNVIAFGAEFDMEDCSMHVPNENVKKEEFKLMFEIYTKAMTKLMKK